MSLFALRNVVAVTMDPGNRVITDATVVVENDRIREIAPTEHLELPDDVPVLEGYGRHALMPGLVDSHSHSSLMRGVNEDMQLMDWLPYYQLEHRALDEDDAYHAARLCYLEALKHGTTCVMDMYRFMHRCADAAGEVGLRVNLAPYVGDNPGKDFFATPRENRDLVRSHHGSYQGRVRVWMGLEHLLYCSPDAYRNALECQREYGVGIHTHVCEQQDEEAAVTRHFGRRSIDMLDTYGVLGENTLLAHCVWLNDDEISRLAGNGTRVAHCPVSNAKLASGIARLPEMLQAGLTVGLGTDGPVCNNNLNVFEEMKFASLLQKVTRLDPTSINATEALRMATIEGAKTLGLDHEIGSLEVGKKADMLLLDLATPSLTPAVPGTTGGNLLWNLVFAEQGRSIRGVWVDGIRLLEDGTPLQLDEGKVIAAAQRRGEDLMERCNHLAHLRQPVM